MKGKGLTTALTQVDLSSSSRISGWKEQRGVFRNARLRCVMWHPEPQQERGGITPVPQGWPGVGQVPKLKGTMREVSMPTHRDGHRSGRTDVLMGQADVPGHQAASSTSPLQIPSTAGHLPEHRCYSLGAEGWEKHPSG